MCAQPGKIPAARAGGALTQSLSLLVESSGPQGTPGTAPGCPSVLPDRPFPSPRLRCPNAGLHSSAHTCEHTWALRSSYLVFVLTSVTLQQPQGSLTQQWMMQRPASYPSARGNALGELASIKHRYQGARERRRRRKHLCLCAVNCTSRPAGYQRGGTEHCVKEQVQESHGLGRPI